MYMLYIVYIYTIVEPQQLLLGLLLYIQQLYIGLSDADWNGSLLVTHQQFLSCLSALKPSVSEEELEMYRKKQFLQGNNDNT